jgi:hypothetical protein
LSHYVLISLNHSKIIYGLMFAIFWNDFFK